MACVKQLQVVKFGPRLFFFFFFFCVIKILKQNLEFQGCDGQDLYGKNGK